MNKSRYIALACAAIVAISATGCSSSNGSTGSSESSTVSTADIGAEGSQTSEAPGSQQTQSYKTVKVTAVDGNKITADEGEISTNSNGSAPGGEAPDKPSGDGSAPDGEAPDKPSGDGSAPDGEPPAKPGEGGSTFESSGSSIEFTVTDDTQINVEFLQGSSEGTIDDITIGSVLAVTLNEDGTAATVLVKNMAAGNGFGGSSEVTNGTSANTITENTEESDTEYTSIGDDENALRVDSAEATLTNITVNKNGGSSSNDL